LAFKHLFGHVANLRRRMLIRYALKLLRGSESPLALSSISISATVLSAGLINYREFTSKNDANNSDAGHVGIKKKEKVKVVLLRSVPGLGPKGSVVDASAGWMRLNLFPSKIAVYATPENMQRYSVTKEERLKSQNPQKRERAELEGVMDILSRMHVYISRKYKSQEDPEAMVGTVTLWDIMKAAVVQGGVQLHESHLMMDQPISAFGTYKVPLNLRNREDRQVELTVIVNSVKHINHGRSSV
jgi:large subunit ribosomal protein L9